MLSFLRFTGPLVLWLEVDHDKPEWYPLFPHRFDQSQNDSSRSDRNSDGDSNCFV